MDNIFINFVLDESGSMNTIRDATVSGFSEYINSLLDANKANYSISLTKFNTQFIPEVVGVPLSELRGYGDTYKPNGNTALYDAIVDTIHQADQWLKEKAEQSGKTFNVLCVILTDGQENSSHQYKRDDVFKLIQEKEATGFWTFAYLGANQDSWLVGQSMGLAKGSTVDFAATPAGMDNAFRNLSRASLSYSRSRTTSANFWKEDDKDK